MTMGSIPRVNKRYFDINQIIQRLHSDRRHQCQYRGKYFRHF